MNREELEELEKCSDYKFPKHHTIAVRVDGKNFSAATKTLDKPFDNLFSSIMSMTMEQVANEIDGCQAAYTQSDEITFLLYNKDKETPYFGNRLQKIVSIVSSLVTLHFYKITLNLILEYQDYVANRDKDAPENEQLEERLNALWKFLGSNPIFDCRAFLVPTEEAFDVFKIRQNNGITNGINMMATMYLDTWEGKNRSQLRGELFDMGHPWENMPDAFKYGILMERTSEIDPEEIEDKWFVRSEKLIESEEF